MSKVLLGLAAQSLQCLGEGEQRGSKEAAAAHCPCVEGCSRLAP